VTTLRAGDEQERGGWIAAGVAVAVRLAVAAWAGPRFPASADGFYYDTLARRLASGHGYTWLWPDGAVTNVAHYPVGYPALLAVTYLVLGARPLAAMVLNAIFGGVASYGVYRLVAERVSSRASAMGAAIVVAVHPALVPYAAAVMTEGIAAALAVGAAALACSRRSWSAWIAAGLVLGVATLVRPQSLAFAPFLGLLAPPAPARWKTRALAAACVTAATLAVCAPWTARNCVAMHKCSLVSVNGGWNLLIGAQTTNGAWQPAAVPEECRTVWDEAGKDECFGAAARRTIARAPLAWLARAPAKLAVTFDYLGAGPWYLHEANPRAFDEHAKVALGVVETAVTYVLLLAALARVGLSAGPRRGLRLGIVTAGVVLGAASLHGWVAYAALAAAIGAFGRRWLARAPLLVPWTAVVIVLTAATHVAFFGAGRYGLVIVPFVTALAFVRPRAAEA
jgi:hypothetical protein